MPPRRQQPSCTLARKRALLAQFDGLSVSSQAYVSYDFLTFMADVRRNEHILTSMHMINFMKTYHKAWLDAYVDGKVDPYKSLLRLCHWFALRQRFSQLVPCNTKLAELDMVLIRVLIRNDFAATFYEMPRPTVIWWTISTLT
ncbi:hypothetical protein H257_16823 [Aphanomyces astaci]|uniref:Uncharacterized protein n=1 Tax=Aphanomyces astaci TaxID=112090 RepID=W4FGS7_APHAT|nr:hypothetical protein H257_16823 [Aphanomyces astaci]ETV66722.1 hypothetical protein H257_16823 [Aphanomyces astaci]|eukprot:XP_009843698.1 hypothetical protein H257_16823 [Aphanomyces astaci]